MADRADIGMNRALSYFQSSVTPMELRLRNFSKVNSSGLVDGGTETERKWVEGGKKTERKGQ